MPGKYFNGPNASAIRLCALLFASILLFIDRSGKASDKMLEDVFEDVNGSVVLVRTWERMMVPRDGIDLVPITDLGSGVLISEEGDIITAAHLVQVADVVEVEFADGTKVNAKVVASEPTADLALLRLDQVPQNAEIAKVGDSDLVRVGQRVFVIGAPFGLSHTLTVGHVSARHSPGTPGMLFNLAEFFQADVAIHRGNSGGPMFNMNGEVVGIVSYLLSQSGTFEGVGFVVTSNSVRELLLERRLPWSGISVFSINKALAKIFNLPQDTGLMVQQVAEDSPGARLGLLPSYLPAKIGRHELLIGGDIILEVEGITVGTSESYFQLRKHISEVKKGEVIDVRILRHGQIIDLLTTLED